MGLVSVREEVFVYGSFQVVNTGEIDQGGPAVGRDYVVARDFRPGSIWQAL